MDKNSSIITVPIHPWLDRFVVAIEKPNIRKVRYMVYCSCDSYTSFRIHFYSYIL